MLPSTGYFQSTPCPYYEKDLCVRPYCHFRHVRKDSTHQMAPLMAPIESLDDNNAEVLQHLVSEAVKKVLQEKAILPAKAEEKSSDNKVDENKVSEAIVSNVVKELKPLSQSKVFQLSSVPSYSPTPIGESKKKHIPIPYTPRVTREMCVAKKSSSSGKISKRPKSSSVDARKYRVDTQKELSDSQYALKKCGSTGSLLYTPSAKTTLENGKPESSLLYNPSVKTEESHYRPSLSESYKPNFLEDCKEHKKSEYSPSSNQKETVSSYVPSPTKLSDTKYVPEDSSNSYSVEYVPTDRSKLDPEQSSDDGDISNIPDLSSDLKLLAEILSEEPVTDSQCGEASDETRNESEQQSVIIKTEDSCNRIKSEPTMGHGIKSENSGLNSVNKPAEVANQTTVKTKVTSKSANSKNGACKIRNERISSSNGSEKVTISASRKSELCDDGKKRLADVKKKSEKTSLEEVRSVKEKSRQHVEKTNDGRDAKSSDKNRERKHHSSEHGRPKNADKHTSKKEAKQKHTPKEHVEHSHQHQKHGKHKDSHDSFKKKTNADTHEKEKSHDKLSKRRESSSHDRKQEKHKSSDRSVSSDKSRKKLAQSSSEKSNPKSSKHKDRHTTSSSNRSRDRGRKSKSLDKHSRDHKSSSDENKHSKRRSKYNSHRSKSLDERHAYSGKWERKRKFSEKHEKKKRHKNVSTSESSSGSTTRSSFERSVTSESSGDSPEHESNISNSETPDRDIPRKYSPSESSADDFPDEPSIEQIYEDDDVAKECFKIFQEYKPKEKADGDAGLKKAQRQKEEAGEESSKYVPVIVSKQRVAHSAARNVYKPSATVQPKASSSAAVKMCDRWRKLREEHGESSEQVPAPVAPGKVRIAHVPNVSLLLSAKSRMQQQLAERSLKTVTVPQSAPKGKQRVAHVPCQEVLKRPVISVEPGATKIPTNVRQRYLNTIIDECLKICETDKEAYDKAVEEERCCFIRSSSKVVYLNVVANLISRLRKEAESVIASNLQVGAESFTPGYATMSKRVISHTSVLAGKEGTRGTWSIVKQRKTISEKLKGQVLYDELSRYILDEEQLKLNGFPLPHPEEKGRAVVAGIYYKPQISPSPIERICSRCGKHYRVNDKGCAVKEENCIYHWGRKYKKRVKQGYVGIYSCCDADGDNDAQTGCCVASYHVSDNFDPENLRGFVKTLPKEAAPNVCYGVYALDCEMSYTTAGSELTRVTVIDEDFKSVYEALVKPENPILDYNTRFSGITAEDMDGVTTNIRDVQATLLSMFSDRTILIGHSLESDFKALKLIHYTVVDTSVVFPHRLGPPRKRALRQLCGEYIKKIIQNDVGGHDSAEDAIACMELMLWKLKEDMKGR